MSTASTTFKLGLFTLVGIAALLAAAFGLGAWSVRGEMIPYHTYFDESVQGLDIGAPVKYRGVLIGSVGEIRVAPDNRHVDVMLALDLREARRLRLAEGALGLRTQLGTQGITGVKFVNIDFFDPKMNPPPPLGFQPDAHYVPAAPSLMKGLEDNLAVVLGRLPALFDATIATLDKIEVILVDFRGANIPTRLGKTLDGIGGAVADIRTLVRHVDRARIPDKTVAALENLDVAVAHAGNVLARLDGDGGLVASTQRATESIGDLSRKTKGASTELARTLRDLDEAAQAIRDLAQAIEREPDMLVKGRAKEARP